MNDSFHTVRLYHVIGRMITLYRRLKKQEQYLKNCLPSVLSELAPGHQESFSIKRTIKYYQLGLNLICDNLYQLTGRELSPAEHKRILLLSIFGPLFDDLFDEHVLNHQQIQSLVAAPETYVAVNVTDELVRKIYLELLHSTPRPQEFTRHLQEVCHWQEESLKQLNEEITEQDLYLITYNKSYYAVLLYCAVLDHYPGPGLLSILYPVAGLMQLTNDAFDVWKDIHNDVYTLPNLHRNFDQLKQKFLTETIDINNKLSQLPYPVKGKRRFAITIHSLHAMGWISLDQLQKATASISTIAELKTLNRKTLVCDMDSLPQQIKWLKLIHRFSKYKALP